MAILFISPEKTQRRIFWVAATLFVAVLAVASFIILLPEIKNQLAVTPAEGVFIAPDTKIDFILVDSDRVKNLEPFSLIQMDFTYVALDQSGGQQSGNIAAGSASEAKSILEGLGLKEVVLQSLNVGRPDPFTSYYQTVILSAPKK